MTNIDSIYAGIFRALLTEDALDRAGRPSKSTFEADLATIERLVALDALDDVHVSNAKAMSVVYTAIAAFENSVRNFISSVMLENVGADWWETSVSEKIRKQAESRREDERKIKWHTQRGADPINFTMLPNLINIIRQNFVHFEAFIPDIEWAAGLFDTIEKSRNVIMHSGHLSQRDVARLGTLFRDWRAQVAS